MTLSKKTKYALAALRVLASQPDGQPMLISDIAKRGDIPKKFLELILLELKKGHVVDSKKGQGGGYFLRQTPDQIRLGVVIQLVSGPLGMTPCVNEVEPVPCDDCPDPEICPLKEVMGRALTATTDVLNHETLADLTARESRLIQKKRDYMFHI